MDRESLLHRLLTFVPLLLSLTVHEWAHAYSAFRLGDDTASRQGRLTLNPIAHIDPIGTVILPLLGVPFGWAKPVPVNPLRFRRGVSMRGGMMLTAAAGPLSNLVIAILSSIAFGLLLRFRVHAGGGALRELLETTIVINVALAIFNMIPIPPLDGSRVVDGLVPLRLRPLWESFTRYSSVLLLLLVLGSSYVLAGPMGFMQTQIGRFIWFVAGA